MNTTAKQIGLILLISGVLAGVSSVVHPRRIPWLQDWSHQVEDQAAARGLSILSFAAALETYRSGNAVFIDARPAAHYASGHIAGAASIPFDGFENHFSTLMDLIGSGRPLVVYCRNRECDEALLLASELQAMGAKQVTLFVDGFESWAEHGGEVEP